MTKTQLELALRMAGEIAREHDFIVFGSQCILGVLPTPPKDCLTSLELDLYPRNYPQTVPLLVAKLGRRSGFSVVNGFFVDCVTPELAALPDGWTERLIPFRTKRTGGVTGWCLELHDLAASKLAAGRKKDLAYVRALLRSRLIKAIVLENRLKTLAVSASRREDFTKVLQKLVAGLRRRKGTTRKPKQ
ncbi:MAG: hypothetical protein HY735_05855 [Verrucomicrobia bacterium]|nr:hypothetical protein [Verrucomicrobiota bacterium]